MADNSKKVSELPTTTNAASTDRILILRSPASNASVRTITANDFANSTKLSFAAVIPNTTVVSNSVTVASNGTFAPFSIVTQLSAADYIEIFAYQSSGGNLSVTSVSNQTSVQMSYLGA